MRVRQGLIHHEDFLSFERLLSLLRVMADVLPISDELVVQRAVSRRSDKHYIYMVSLPCGAWCDCEELKTVKRTSCNTCIETVSQECEYACASASYCAS